MKRNWFFQSKQQLRGFSEGDFIDRGILLWPFPLDWSLFCLTFRLIFLLKIQMQRSSDQNSENYFSTFVPIFFWWFLVISTIVEEFVLTRSSIFRHVILSPKEWFSFLPMWHFWEKFGQNWWWNAIKNAW